MRSAFEFCPTFMPRQKLEAPVELAEADPTTADRDSSTWFNPNVLTIVQYNGWR